MTALLTTSTARSDVMIRYTPRDIPKELDLLVREEAMKQILYYDLDDLAGT
jgi:hypothetical protein